MPPFDPATSTLIVCVNKQKQFSTGVFFNDDVLDYAIRMFPLQISLVALLQTILHLLLRPFGTTPVVSQILGGVLIGPTCLTGIQAFKNNVFPDSQASTHMTNTLGSFCGMLYLFVLGVKSDSSILLRSSRRETSIGILTFIVPLLVTLPLSFAIQNFLPNDLQTLPVYMVAGALSLTSFQSVASFLGDLKILNTELGRLATSASIFSGLLSFLTGMIVLVVKQFHEYHLGLHSSAFAMHMFSMTMLIVFISVILRKVVMWMIRASTPGEPVKDYFIFIILVMVLGTGLIGEWLGAHCLLGPMVLGFIIPDGPPLGSALVEKLEPFVYGLFLPLYFTNLGVSVNFWVEDPNIYWVVTLFATLSIIGKLLGTIIPSILYGIPFGDSFTLGLILSTVGIYDVMFYGPIIAFGGVDVYSVMVICIIVISAATSLLVRSLYNPSKRYVVYKNRTIQNVKTNEEFRVQVCIYSEDNVPTMVNILQASNPTRTSPIQVSLLHLIELVGRSTPLLINHKSQERLFHEPTASDTIINSFKIYEKQNQGAVFVTPFTSFTSFMSAHDDICTIAIDRRTSLIILPFHKQWNIDGTSQNSKWGSANIKVLKHAPCSVGVLIDRGTMNGARSVLSSWSNIKIGVFFLGDADDREALCYAMRMAANQNVQLTLHRLITTDPMTTNVTEKMLDNNVINEFRLNSGESDNLIYREEKVKDGEEIISMMRTTENHYNLILVGRSHYSYSRIFSGLKEWLEYPELGFLGDMFASTDYKGNTSVLVLQQHSCVPRDLILEDLDDETTAMIHDNDD